MTLAVVAVQNLQMLGMMLGHTGNARDDIHQYRMRHQPAKKSDHHGLGGALHFELPGRDYKCPTALSPVHTPFALQLGQRLYDRDPAYGIIVGELPFRWQSVVARKLTCLDPFEQRTVDLVIEGQRMLR